MQRGTLFVLVFHAPHSVEFLCPGQVVGELFEHAAAGKDWGELVLVADENQFRAGAGDRGHELVQFGSADHGCFVDDDQCLVVEIESPVFEHV